MDTTVGLVYEHYENTSETMEDGLSGANFGNWILEVVGISVFILSSKVMERMKIAIL